MRLAWFSPVPPDTSGIAAYTSEVVPLLASHVRALDLYTDRPGGPVSGEASLSTPLIQSAQSAQSADPPQSAKSAHEFVWRHRRDPYDLIVYQMGNSAAHDFMWAYLFRYPGLLVLHDAQLHQARALWLLRRLEPRLDDYLAELAANHPDAPADLGHLFAAGLGGSLFRLWPLVALVIRASRLTVVHNRRLAADLARAHPDAAIRSMDMGVSDPLQAGLAEHREAEVLRARLGIPGEACVIGAYGGLTPEKRIPQLLEAIRRLDNLETPLHVLLVGQRASHYDVDADVRRLDLTSRVHVVGYVPDAGLPAHLAAADVCWCPRWPSNGETSASWLRCLAAGRPTIITALSQLADVPVLNASSENPGEEASSSDAIGMAVDPVDEAIDVPRVLTALAGEPGLRKRLGANARRYWQAHHTLPAMADAYLKVIADAAAMPKPRPELPAHLIDDQSGTARRLLSEMGLPELPW